MKRRNSPERLPKPKWKPVAFREGLYLVRPRRTVTAKALMEGVDNFSLKELEARLQAAQNALNHAQTHPYLSSPYSASPEGDLSPPPITLTNTTDMEEGGEVMRRDHSNFQGWLNENSRHPPPNFKTSFMPISDEDANFLSPKGKRKREERRASTPNTQAIVDSMEDRDAIITELLRAHSERKETARCIH